MLLVLAVLGIAGFVLNDRHKAAEAAKRSAEHKKDCDARLSALHSRGTVPKDCEDVLVTYGLESSPAQPPKIESAHQAGQGQYSISDIDTVDCFDKRTGKLIPDKWFAQFGGVQTGCGPNYIQKPAGLCKQLRIDFSKYDGSSHNKKGDIFDQVAADCYLPMRPGYRKEAKPDPLGIRPGSTESCTGTNPNDPCNIR